jgi:short-subunit dehydrogenase
MELKNNHVLITGSNRGIGRAVALMCAADGAYLHLANRTQDEELKAECLKAGSPGVTLYKLDLVSKDGISKFLTQIQHQEIDILFNNAGQLTGGLLEEQPLDEIYDMLQVNLNAVIHLTHGILPQMLKRKKGKIINNSSVSGVMNMPCASTYSAAKTALVAFSNCLRNELGGTGVSVLLLLTPGVETRMFGDIPKKYGKNLDLSFLEKSLTAKEYAQMIREAILEDLELLKPAGATGFGLLLAQHVPRVFNRMIAKKFKR